MADVEVSSLSVSGNAGYQVSDYYKNYFSGVLSDAPETNYVMFCTRENDVYNSSARYYLVFGDSLELTDGQFVGADLTVYECYQQDSQYFQNVTTESLSLPAGSYMYYSNLGSYSDIRGGGTNVQWLTLLLLLAVLFGYIVLRDILGNVVFRRTCNRVRT